MSDSDSSVDNEDLSAIEEQDSSDVLKILITTDNHLGFMEKDPERGNDSFVSFAEALEIANQEKVDFILLGGDLFHENKPSRDCLTKCQKLLREYCFGEKPIEFEIKSDEERNFGHTGFPQANFNDPNLNISIPVLSIHGNHDDPTGSSNLSAMDTLAAAGLVNYFGKSNTSCNLGIDVNPILIQKGCTQLAIYGLGAIKDERLHNMFEKGLVQYTRPSENGDEWFNIFVIHQNRSAHGKKNYIPETFLPDFLDLVIWGHEHECRLRPEFNELQQFFVSQPGSSVITSLSESEMPPKHVGILKVYKKNFKLEPVPLRSVRQFMIDNVVLNESNLNPTDKNIEYKTEQFLIKKVEKMIETCIKNRFFYEKQPIKPLIRLKVDYTDFDTVNENRFAQKFIDKVANPRNILQFYKKKTELKLESNLDMEAAKILHMHGGSEPLEFLKVQDLVVKYFNKAEEKNRLQALTEKGLGDAIQEYIEKDEKDAISELINFQIDKIQKYLKNQTHIKSDAQLNDEIRKFQKLRLSNQEEEDSEIKEIFEKSKKLNTQTNSRFMNSDENDEDFEESEIKKSKKYTRDSSGDEIESSAIEQPSINKRGGRGRGTRGTRARGSRGNRGGRGAVASATSAKPSSNKRHQNDSDDDIIDLDDDDCAEMIKKSNSSKSKTLASNQSTKSIKSTSSSTRRTRIDYDDDDDDIVLSSNTKKTKQSPKKTFFCDDDDDENEGKITNTYSIFKQIAKKK